MTMYSLHTPPLSLPSSADNGRTTDVKMVIMWTVLTALWSVSYWVSQWKKYMYHPITILPNICKYCPVPNNPVPVSFWPYAQCLSVGRIRGAYYVQSLVAHGGVKKLQQNNVLFLTYIWVNWLMVSCGYLEVWRSRFVGQHNWKRNDLLMRRLKV